MAAPLVTQCGDGTNVQPVIPTTIDLSFTSASAAGTVAQAPATGLGPYRSLMIYAALTGATGGTLDIYLQMSPDSGTTWIDFLHFAQIAAAAAIIYRAWPLTKIAAVATPVTIGTGTTPALAANSTVGGDWGDRLRVVSVAGASTSAGAAQVIKLILSP